MASPPTRDELIEAWRRALPESYTRPLEEENDGRGFDLIAAAAAVLERIGIAAETTTQAMFVLPHSIQTAPEGAGETRATGNITLRRAAPTNGDINLEEGDLLQVEIATIDGETIFEIGLELAADVTLAAGSPGPVTAAVRAARPGYQGNVEDTQGRSVAFLRRTTATLQGATTTADNEITATGTGDDLDEQMLGAFVRFIGGPNYGTGPRRVQAWNAGVITVDGAALVAGNNNDLEVVDVNELGVTAELDGDLTGGVYGWLDALGGERDIGRNANEGDPAYRPRIVALPDVVAPNALQRAARRILEPLGIRFRIMETRDPAQFRGAAWGFFPYDNPNTSLFPEDGEQHFWQGGGFEYRGFYVVVERQGYGDPGWPFEAKWPGGSHPSNAWGFMGYNGAALGFWADMRRLIDEIEKTRAAGVPWVLVLVDSIP